MASDEKTYQFGDESMEEYYTTRFLELLIQFNYEWSPGDQKSSRINLEQNEKEKFLSDLNQILEDFDETRASTFLSRIKEIYDEEYSRLLAASKTKDDSKFYWFPLADRLFRESMNLESVEDTEITGSISSHFPTVESDVSDETPFRDPLPPTSENSNDSDQTMSLSYERCTNGDSSSSESEKFTDENRLSPDSKNCESSEPTKRHLKPLPPTSEDSNDSDQTMSPQYVPGTNDDSSSSESENVTNENRLSPYSESSEPTIPARHNDDSSSSKSENFTDENRLLPGSENCESTEPATNPFIELSARGLEQQRLAFEKEFTPGPARDFVKEVAFQTVLHLYSGPMFGPARQVDSNIDFANAAVPLLQSLPSNVASECENYILEFLDAIVKRKERS